uniref:Putative conserved plasma membrane protein n=1 Tax=Tabanus bromius TaxID=304241 RepID=A0A0K8TQL2_TABBR
MSLSKPVYNLLGLYFEQLFNHPVRTKSFSSCFLAVTANYVSQRLNGAKATDYRSLLAYGLFGLLFGGTIPHYFYFAVDKLLAKDMKFRQFFFFFLERLIYAPTFQAVSLYVLSRFEGQENTKAVEKLKMLYLPLLQANWRYLSLPVFINIYFVPPMLRVLMANLIGFIWIIYLANKRRTLNSKR